MLMLAEWGKQQGLFINYSGNSNDAETSEKVHKVCRDIIRELSAVTRFYVLINEEYKKDSIKFFAAAQIQNKNVVLVPVYKLFIMGVPRDYGPLIAKKMKGKNQIIRFHWDYVGADFINPDTAWAKKRELISDRYYAQMSSLLSLEVKASHRRITPSYVLPVTNHYT